MAVGNVTVYIAGRKMLLATKLDYDAKYDNSTDDTFDGKILTQGPPTWTVKVSRIRSYNAKFETELNNAIDSAGDDGLPITCVDDNLTALFSGCIIESQSMSRDPKKKMTADFSFTAKDLEEKWK